MKAKLKRRLEKVYGQYERKQLVKSLIPAGRSGNLIYAVTLKEHPGLVKIGMTKRWSSRRIAYANWNLSNGDGIDAERVFALTEEYVDLAAVERYVLANVPFKRAYKTEWFYGEIDEAAREIDRILAEIGITSEIL